MTVADNTHALEITLSSNMNKIQMLNIQAFSQLLSGETLMAKTCAVKHGEELSVGSPQEHYVVCNYSWNDSLFRSSCMPRNISNLFSNKENNQFYYQPLCLNQTNCSDHSGSTLVFDLCVCVCVCIYENMTVGLCFSFLSFISMKMLKYFRITM